MRIILLAIVAALSLSGQRFESFSTVCTQTSVTSAKTTIAQAAAATATTDRTYTAELIAVVVQSTVDGTVTIERSGTAPTATAAAVNSLNPGGRTARVTGWCASNVGAGTAISIAYKLTANVPLVLNMENVKLLGLASTKNVTVSVALGSSGNASTAIYHKENF